MWNIIGAGNMEWRPDDVTAAIHIRSSLNQHAHQCGVASQNGQVQWAGFVGLVIGRHSIDLGPLFYQEIDEW